ncbi:MAG: ABC transporter substrate-binding protein [Thaumarchaeota archaeon]|jgi:branched-chain amino acid transport system substrate-binding protein|nr:ABC transporter substrate-binding protein [Candidatus Wolframiiraptor allenii]
MMLGVSRAIAVVLAVVMLIIGIGVGMVVTPYVTPPPTPTIKTVTETRTVTVGASVETVTVAGETKTIVSTTTITMPGTAAGGLSGEVPIGALLPLSGPLGQFGENDKVAVEFAVAEINEFLEKIGAGWRLKLYVEDTETKPEVALEKLMSLHAKGVKFVVGPMASGEVLKLKEYADSNKILVISQSSTAPVLGIAGDYIYRFVPPDDAQGVIGPKFAKMVGATHIIIVHLANTWGDGLAAVVERTAKDLGINVVSKIRIPEAGTDYSAEVASLVSEVEKLVGQGIPLEKIMVQLITYGEAVTFFHSAVNYDILWKVKWFGSDGTARHAELVKDKIAAEFSSKVRFVSPIAMEVKTPVTQKVLAEIQRKLGREPEPYAYNSYDAVWVIALSLLAANKYDADAVIAAMPKILEHYYGASGPIMLNEAGDRLPETYVLTEVVSVAGAYEWRDTGYYKVATGELSWS